VTTVAVSTESPGLASGRERGAVRNALADTLGFLGTWLRLLWRHWPALIALALGGGLVRQLLMSQTVDASKWRDGLGGLLLFPLVPAAVLVAMVLMLRVMRPSLPYLGPRGQPESMLVYLASVLIPFLAFYFAGDFATYDRDMYALYVADQQVQEVFTSSLENGHSIVQTKFLTTGLIVVGVAAVAFVLRWVFDRLGVVRRRPYLALPALYLEVLWIYTAFLVASEYTPKAWQWLEHTRIWVWATSGFDSAAGGQLDTAQSYLDEGTTALRLVILTPIAALVAGSVVLAARHKLRDPSAPATRLRRILRIGAQAGKPLAGRFALIGDALRRVFQAGVPATMVFCLSFLCVQAASAYLAMLERTLIGARDAITVWPLIQFPLRFINDAMSLVLLMALIAAFVDRTARRIARRSGESPPLPIREPALAGAPSATTTTARLGMAPGRGVELTQRTPAPGSLELTQRTPAPGSLESTQRVAPPHQTGPTRPWPPPPTGQHGQPGYGSRRLGDGQQDVPGEQRQPRDPQTGWSGFGR
jgi:hypothetical protein